MPVSESEMIYIICLRTLTIYLCLVPQFPDSVLLICTSYANRWRFKFGLQKSQCMIGGKSPHCFSTDPTWYLDRIGTEIL